MKKLWMLCLTLLTAVLLTAPAFADILWEPSDDEFYLRHRDECSPVVRGFYANGPEGFVTLWDAPGGSVVEAQYENGTRLCVYWQYKDWGCITVFMEKGKHIDGWVPMKDLYLVYDHISFEEEYGDQFRPYNGEFADCDVQVGDEIWLWETPLNGEPKDSVSLTADYLDALKGGWDNDSYISKLYTDENGRDWGFVSYMFAYRDLWILLDNPADAEAGAGAIPDAEKLIAAGELIAPQTPKLPAASYTPYFLVGGVAVVTAGLIFWFYGKGRKKRA